MRRALSAPITASLIALAACSNNVSPPAPPDLVAADLVFAFPEVDIATEQPNACGDFDPTCAEIVLFPPLPLPSDPMPDPNVRSDGVGRAPDGTLRLDGGGCLCGSCFLHRAAVANAGDLGGMGSLSIIDTRNVREVARYPTITCFSRPGDSRAPCDGMNGCCAGDDEDRYRARLAGKPLPPRQPVNLIGNRPSRTGLDFDGSVLVANEAPAGQASITKIALDPNKCIDHDNDGKIETSRDQNQDGLIETDCNGDGQPDDIASVKAKPCTNGLAQEFYGLDDECVLFTTNVGAPMQRARALALGQGAADAGPSDAWVGTMADGQVRRIDGTSGEIKMDITLPAGCQPFGAVIDSQGAGWVVSDGTVPFCYFHGYKGPISDRIRDPMMGAVTPYTVGMDRDQNVWISDATGPGAWRFTPDRTKVPQSLAQGVWTRIEKAGMVGGATGASHGFANDSRNNKSYFGWLATAGGMLVQIPASAIATSKTDQVIDGSQYPVMPLPSFQPIAVDMDSNQDVLVVSEKPSAVIRVAVDFMGKMTLPDLKSAPAPMKQCPAGDRCALKGPNPDEPGTSAYSNLAFWGLRDHCRPAGTWSYIVRSTCKGSTRWLSADWESIVPPNTTLDMHMRAGTRLLPDQTWSPWTSSTTNLVVDLSAIPEIAGLPNLQIEFMFATQDRNATPSLRRVQIQYECK